MVTVSKPVLTNTVGLAGWQ